MKLYWINKCKDNSFRCPKCQLLQGDEQGQMSATCKNHRISMIDGQVKCVACNSVLGYFPRGKDENSLPVKFGWSATILDTLEYVTPIEQNEF